MQLKESTRSVLKNFSQIRDHLVYYPGNVIWTQTENNTLLAKAEMEDELPVEGGIYKLTRFLGAWSLFSKDCAVDFGEFEIEISGDGRSVTMTVADPSILEKPLMDDLQPPEGWPVTFPLSDKDFSHIKKSAGVLDLPHITFFSRDGGVYIGTENCEEPSRDAAEVRLGDYEGEDFRQILSRENILFLPQDFSVSLSLDPQAAIARFSTMRADDGDYPVMTYWVACEDLDETVDGADEFDFPYDPED